MPEGATGFRRIVRMDDSRISRKNNGEMFQKHKACGTAKTRWVTAGCLEGCCRPARDTELEGGTKEDRKRRCI
jgi:hypothetical protein